MWAEAKKIQNPERSPSRSPLDLAIHLKRSKFKRFLAKPAPGNHGIVANTETSQNSRRGGELLPIKRSRQRLNDNRKDLRNCENAPD